MEKEKVNVIVGRFQPFTLGHIKGAEYVLKEYKLRTVFCIVETPESKLDKKHPFPSDLIVRNNQDCKGEWFAGMFPIRNADIGKIAQVCRDHNFEPVMWTCGSDRVEAYKKQACEKYINMYNLDPDFKVVEIPRTDDDISATKVRQAIKAGDKKTYEKMMPSWSHKDFDSYKPFITEAKAVSLYRYITEGFFDNIDAQIIPPEEWFSKIGITATDQYLTKYNTKTCIRDNKKQRITFTNTYKKNNSERNFTIDLYKYMPKLIEYDPECILVAFGTGLYTFSMEANKNKIKFKHQDRAAEAAAKGAYLDTDKKIRVTVKLMPGKNPAPNLEMLNGTQVNKMLDYKKRDPYLTSYASHRKSMNSKPKILLEFVAYLNDYPFEDDNVYEIINNL